MFKLCKDNMNNEAMDSQGREFNTHIFRYAWEFPYVRHSEKGMLDKKKQ